MLRHFVTPTVFFTALIYGLATRALTGKLHVNGWGDVIALPIFLVVMSYLLRERPLTGDESARHESASEHIAFRLGKSLNRIRRRLKRRGVSA